MNFFDIFVIIWIQNGSYKANRLVGADHFHISDAGTGTLGISGSLVQHNGALDVCPNRGKGCPFQSCAEEPKSETGVDHFLVHTFQFA